MAGDDAGDAKTSRSKVVRLKLRYATATVDAFIEKYALDVSPRGIHVNIARPLALGTLVRLEIRLANEQVLIRAAGTVVRNRDRAQASSTRPAGLWIAFLKIDEPSKAFIENLVSTKAGAGRTYEEHEEEGKAEVEDAAVERPAEPPQQAAAPPAPAARSIRATLVGITAPAMLPPRPRLPTLPPVPLPPPAKARSVPPPPDRGSGEESEAEDITVVWGYEPSHQAVSVSPAKAPSLREETSTGVPPAFPPRPRLPSLPPTGVLRARVPSAAPPEPSDRDAEDDTIIWDREALHQELSASAVPPTSARKPTLSGVPALATPAHGTGASLPAPVTWSAIERSTDVARAPPTPVAPPLAATAQEIAARREASLKATVIGRRSPAFSPPGSSGRTWGRTGAWMALGFFAVVALALAVGSTTWFRELTTATAAPGVAPGGATSAAAAMTTAETAPVPIRQAVEALADAAPAATTPAGVTEAPPTTGASSQEIALPTPAPRPRPAPAPRPPAPSPRAASPGVTDISIVPTKPKPKPAPTIDDGF
jgi:uncharacterized protein (TIGR02266 family)